jgi:hypothetical protein
MPAAKYARNVRTLKFKEYEQGGLRVESVMDGKYLGVDCHINYGCFWTAGKIGKNPDQPHTHDFDQVLLFAGSDMDDIGELGAEVELCLGEDLDTHMITSTTAVAIPRGVPHFPATVNFLNKRFFYYEISIAPEYRETVYKTDKKPGPLVSFRADSKKYVMPLAFSRKGAWTYGPLNRDDGGGYISFVITKDKVGFDFVMLYESMKKGPYRLCPDPDKPHAHPTTQIMCFLGTDTDDLTDLGAEFEICLGKEEEKHTFTNSTAVITQPFLPHWPGGVVKLDRPMVMCDIHPFGNDA